MVIIFGWGSDLTIDEMLDLPACTHGWFLPNNDAGAYRRTARLDAAGAGTVRDRPDNQGADAAAGEAIGTDAAGGMGNGC